MPTNYPGAIDNFVNPTSGEPMTTPSHSGQHTNINEAVTAVQTAVGTTSAPNFAKLGSPHFTGVPTAPTNSTATDATTQIATDAFVQNAVSAYAAPGLRLIYVDELGADPTGVNDSSAVIRAKQTALGSATYLLVFGQGTYLMSSAFVTFTQTQGVRGAGSTLTGLSWSGSGSLITAKETSFNDAHRAGRFEGFSIDGPYGSSATSGITYGNLQGIVIDDVAFYGLAGGAILGISPGGGWAEESQITRVLATECGAQLGAVFQYTTDSFDYTRFDAVVVVEANIDVLSLIGGAAMQGLNLSLRGNCHGATGSNTGAIVAIDRGNTSGTSNLRNAHFAVAMEANDSPGTVGHYQLWMGSRNSTSQFAAEGIFHLFPAGATPQGGIYGGTGGGNVPVSFSGISNDTSGGDYTPGDALAVIGGSGWTPAQTGFGVPYLGNIYWQLADVCTGLLVSGNNTLIFNGANGFVRKVELFLKQPASGADGTVTWPSNVKWPAATPPTLSTVNGYVDRFHFTYIPFTGFYYGELVGVHYA
jgi:hypothetical protein